MRKRISTCYDLHRDKGIELDCCLSCHQEYDLGYNNMTWIDEEESGGYYYEVCCKMKEAFKERN